MTIQEMHQLFRVVGQQMGMQTIRAILPEEIDVFLNMAINEKINEVLASNVLSDTDKVLTGNAKIGNLNFFRTLQKKGRANIVGGDGNVNRVVSCSFDMTNVMLITGMAVSYETDGQERAKWYDCRLIDIDEVNNTINDYCNSPSYDYPIFAIDAENNNNLNFTIYTGNKEAQNVYVIYIKSPDIVSFENSVNCDLPDYAHNDIVQLAVQKYFNSVGSTTHNVE